MKDHETRIKSTTFSNEITRPAQSLSPDPPLPGFPTSPTWTAKQPQWPVTESGDASPPPPKWESGTMRMRVSQPCYSESGTLRVMGPEEEESLGGWKLQRWVTTRVANQRFESGTPQMSPEPRTWVRNPKGDGAWRRGITRGVKTATVSHDESRQPEVWVGNPANESGTPHMSQEP